MALTAVEIANSRTFAAPAAERLGQPHPFDFAWLKQTAKTLASKAYVAPETPAADIIAKIDFDVAQKIKFRADRALWGDGSGPFPVRLFHVDKFNPLPIQINVVSGGIARRVAYSTQDFDYGDTGLDKKLPADLGFSGFRVMDGADKPTDWLAFQGASYFRSSGQENQYGGSARGIAVNTTASTKEEFPRFTEFWLVEPESE
ncbi:MAG: glucan biosynthesis protein, partial [Terriglobia bacterium]